MSVEVVSTGFEGEYPTGVYWTIGEERSLDESYIADLPEGLEVEEDEDAEASPMSAEAEAPPEPAEVTGDMLDVLDETIDSMETAVTSLRAMAAIARAAIEGTPGDVSEEAAPE